MNKKDYTNLLKSILLLDKYQIENLNYGISNNRYLVTLTEANINNLLKKINYIKGESTKSFGIITSYRSNTCDFPDKCEDILNCRKVTKQENIAMLKEFESYVRNQGYGFLKVMGGYKNLQDKVEFEPSLFIYNIPYQDMENLALWLCNYQNHNGIYCQESFIYSEKPSSDFAYLYIRNMNNTCKDPKIFFSKKVKSYYKKFRTPISKIKIDQYEKSLEKMKQIKQKEKNLPPKALKRFRKKWQQDNIDFGFSKVKTHSFTFDDFEEVPERESEQINMNNFISLLENLLN